LTENDHRPPASNGGNVSSRAEAGVGNGSRRSSVGPLSKREREVVAMLADGESGAQIAERLVLSPETVRTHIRNAMTKLGASSRAQAVALAVQRREIDWPRSSPATEGLRPASDAPGSSRSGATVRSRSTAVAAGRADTTLTALLADLVSLHDVDGGMIFLTEGDGLSLRQVAVLGDRGQPGRKTPGRIQLGEGALGRVALERRARLVHGSGSAEQTPDRAMMCVPMTADGRLVGVICLTVRPSRLVGRNELLLLQAHAGRVAEVLLSADDDQERRLKVALKRFRASWSSSRR
jgi:DNA-binding CsgD family transcriptional regulator